MSNYKLGVEVLSAHELVAKDNQGSSNACVELHFDDQKFRTTTKDKDLNPVWNETFYFNISDPNNLSNLGLEVYVYNYNKTNGSRSCLGKVCLTGTSFVPYPDAVDLHYPLEKKSLFSRAKGELGLKVFITDNPSVRSSNPLPAINFPQQSQLPPQQQIPDSVRNLISDNNESDSRRTFRHLPNPKQQENSPAKQVSSNEMKSAPQPANFVRMYQGPSPQPGDYSLKETSPFLGGGQVVGGRVIRGNKRTSTYDLVEPMQYLFVRVVKARELPSMDLTGSLDPYVEVKIGNYKGTTTHFEKRSNPEWNDVFAFAKDRMQASVLEVVVKDKDVMKDDFVGMVRFDLNEVPARVAPDSPLAPQWYRLEQKNGEKKKGEVMLAVWYGTQADEAFPDALHSDTMTPLDGSSAVSTHFRSKVYHSPRLWYLRVNVIEAQDLVVSDRGHFPDSYVTVKIGNQISKTKSVLARNLNPIWNDDLMFVVAEPFEDHLILSVEDRVGPNKEETLGRAIIQLNSVEKRVDNRLVHSKWFSLGKSMSDAITMEEDQQKKKDKFSSRLHLRLSLDGGYHVLDESTHYSSDLRPSARQLWKSSIGVLELGILSAAGLPPMKTRDQKGTSDTYCVAKYGHKWVRTRTIVDSLNPKYNEQYTWEVYDPSTVLTIGVFDNSQIQSINSNKDMRVGKVRVRLSTLQAGRVYTHTYPLLVLHPSGVKKMGELHLAIRFSCTSMMNMMSTYARPLLPKMHYSRPLTVMQQDMLRFQAMNIVAARLGRAEPPLRKEVVEYMSDVDSHLWSMRRSKANFFRLMNVLSGLFSVGKWFEEVCTWKKPITTGLVHVLFMMLVCFPDMILPTMFLYMFVIGAWNFRYRPRYPPHMDTRISHAEAVHQDELDEEFDTFPTTRSPELVRVRYDRLRSVAGRIQTVVGDVATQGERVLGVLSWRDPRATVIFMIFCLVAALVLYATPFQVIALLGGGYVMRHPKLRHKMPSPPLNFFRRLPAMADCML